jgi:hypothetical protein
MEREHSDNFNVLDTGSFMYFNSNNFKIKNNCIKKFFCFLVVKANVRCKISKISKNNKITK